MSDRLLGSSPNGESRPTFGKRKSGTARCIGLQDARSPLVARRWIIDLKHLRNRVAEWVTARAGLDDEVDVGAVLPGFCCHAPVLSSGNSLTKSVGVGDPRASTDACA